VGNRLQARRESAESRVVARLTFAYLLVFSLVIAALSVLAYELVAANYRDALAPALDTEAGRSALGAAERKILGAIALLDVALLMAVGVASYLLARIALRPLAQARRREERFAADAAHELRTPLGAIASVAQAARDGGPHDAAFGAIARRALEAGTLVSDLLTLARKSDGEALIREPVDLAAIVARAASETRETNPGIRIECDCREAIVEGDEPRLLQLVRNLLDNATRHAKSRVDVRLSGAGSDVLLEVEDDGPGVDPELRPRLFERFAKGTNSPGSGLGLAICRWIADAHGGTISFSGGSRFAVQLRRYP
jgi:signal transduction histidine kinase